MTIFEQILPDSAVRQGLVDDLKATLNGQKKSIRVILFNGPGSSGKTTLINALRNITDVVILLPIPSSHISQENMREKYKRTEDDGVTVWYPTTHEHGIPLENNKIYVISGELHDAKYHNLFADMMDRPGINSTIIMENSHQLHMNSLPSYLRIVKFPVIFDSHADTNDAHENRITYLTNELRIHI